MLNKEKIHEIIFEADTPEGKAFDLILLFAILVSVVTVMLESIDELNAKYSELFKYIEWVVTIFFTIEYILRLYCVRQPMKYATSFFGIIDLLAILPSYLGLFISGTHYLSVIRSLRLMRIFRILKLVNFTREGRFIYTALKSSVYKIGVFLFFIFLLVVIVGSMMYLIETGSEGGFTSIPKSIYWAIVTVTTVGYGDITPVTNLGQFMAAVLMLLGYAIIAVPTGIVSAEMVSSQAREHPTNTQSCRNCGHDVHSDEAKYCESCGFFLEKDLDADM